MALSPSQIQYYVGQGSVWVAPRASNGPIVGPFRNVGDCEELALDFSKQKMVEIEENITGFGGLSGYASVAIPTMFTLSMVSIMQANLQLALYGNLTTKGGGTVTGEALTLYPGGRQWLSNLGVSGVSLSPVAGQVGAITVTQGTGYATAPAVALSAPPAGGVQATAVATLVSAADIAIQITNAGSGYTTAPTVTLTGGGFTTAATATATLTTTTALVSGTDYAIGDQFGSVTALDSTFWAQFGPAAGIALTAAYSYIANQGTVGGLQQAQMEYAIRFDGLNVMDPQNSPTQNFGAVSVYLNRCRTDLAKNFSFIGKKEAPLPVTGAILLDTLAPAGMSPYFSITQQ